MTPNEHAEVARALLAKAGQPGQQAGLLAQRAVAHAQLARTSGVGDDYETADAALRRHEHAPWSPYLLDVARAHALLAGVDS